jgi:hypothetical protein
MFLVISIKILSLILSVHSHNVVGWIVVDAAKQKVVGLDDGPTSPPNKSILNRQVWINTQPQHFLVHLRSSLCLLAKILEKEIFIALVYIPCIIPNPHNVHPSPVIARTARHRSCLELPKLLRACRHHERPSCSFAFKVLTIAFSNRQEAQIKMALFDSLVVSQRHHPSLICTLATHTPSLATNYPKT